MQYATTLNGKTYLIEINDERKITFNGQELPIDFANVSDQPVYNVIIDGQSYEALIYEGEDGAWNVQLRGDLYNVLVEDEREKRLRAAGGGGVQGASGEYHLKAPMPGLIVAVPVTEGQEVRKGDNLIILESMKMQNELKAQRPGVVSRIKVKPGDSVDQGQVMITVS